MMAQRHGQGAGLSPPPFAVELEAAPLPGTVAAPDGGVAFELCGESAPAKGPEDEATRRPAPATDADIPAQANPWPFYLEETSGGGTGARADEEAGEKAADAALAVPWPYHGPPLGEDGPSATIYPQVARPASAGDVQDGDSANEGAKERRDGAESDERAEPQSNSRPSGPEASAASDYPAPLKLTRPHGMAASASTPAPEYKPYSPPLDREGIGQDAPAGPSTGGSTNLAYRPYQPPPSPPPPQEQHPTGAMGTAPHHFYVPQGEAQTTSSPAPPKAAVAATTASPSTVAAATPAPRPATASPHPSTASSAPNATASPRPPSAALATGPPHIQYAPRPQHPPQPYPYGISPYASPSPPVAGMTPVSPMQGYHTPPLQAPSPANSSYNVPQPTYASTPASTTSSPYQTQAEHAPPQPPRPQTHHAMSGPTISPHFSPLSPPPPYSYGGMPRPGSQPPQQSPYHSPPAPYPSPYPTQPTYAYGPGSRALPPSGMQPAPPLPPRPAPGQFGPPPMGFGAGPANAAAYPPPPKTMYAPGPHPPPLPPRSGGSGNLFSGTSSARKWLDKTSQVLESKLEAVLQGPPGPPHRPAYGPPPPSLHARGPPGPPYQGGPPPPGWHPGGQWPPGGGGGGGPRQGGTPRYA